MKEQILKALKSKLSDQQNATDKYEYRCGILDCINIIEKMQPPIPKFVVWKNGSFKLIEDGITHEFENDKDWLTTISL